MISGTFTSIHIPEYILIQSGRGTGPVKLRQPPYLAQAQKPGKKGAKSVRFLEDESVTSTPHAPDQ
jgi:hypothetical protein